MSETNKITSPSPSVGEKVIHRKKRRFGPRSDERTTKMMRVVQQRQQGIVVLQDIQDPHNAEAVLRNCDAFGFQEVWFIFEKATPFNPAKVGKATSSSANKWLDYRIFNDTTTCMQELRNQGYESYGTVLSETAVSMYKTDFTKPNIALLFGNESKGLSPEATALCDNHIMIPMHGMVQSLNLSVTAGIFLFEVTRQRTQKGIAAFNLSETRQTALLTNFSER